MKKQFSQVIAIAIFTIAGTATAEAQAWSLTGNAGTAPGVNFIGTRDNKTLVFKTNNTGRMRITDVGIVGINATNPVGKLNVGGTSNHLSLSSPGNVVVGDITGFNVGFDATQIQARINGKAANLTLNNFGGTTFIGSSTKSSTGLVANGTSYGLSGYSSNSGSTGVNGAGPSADGFGVAGSGFYGTFGYSPTNFGYGIYGQGANGAYGVEGYSNVSIGVFGATGNSSSYAGFFVGNVYTTGSYMSSDEKLKQNIQDFSSAMNIIKQLHPKQYQYRRDGNFRQMNLPEGQHYGLIAQDVEKILPDLVKDSKFDVIKQVQSKVFTDPKNLDAQRTTSIMTKSGETIDFKALNYTEFIPIIIKGMQEQQQTIETLQQINQNLQQQINDLKQQVQNISVTKTDLSVNKSVSNTGYLLQNSPNPFSSNTVIRCFLPANIHNAQLSIFSADGKPLKTYSLSNNGMNEVTVNTASLASGQYSYSLIIDGKVADTKAMVLMK